MKAINPRGSGTESPRPTPACLGTVPLSHSSTGSGFFSAISPIDSATQPKDIAVNEKFPERLQSAVGEMHRCLNAKAYTSTAIAGRRAIEILCADRGIKERTLAESLAKMRERNIIDGSLFEWAEGLRLAGNRAAHDIDTDVAPQDARDVSEFTDALIEYVVVYRERFEQFKMRQSSRKNSK